jgi:hypothetical protein
MRPRGTCGIFKKHRKRYAHLVHPPPSVILGTKYSMGMMVMILRDEESVLQEQVVARTVQMMQMMQTMQVSDRLGVACRMPQLF